MYIVLHDRGNGIYDTVGNHVDRLSAIGEATVMINNGATGEYLVVEMTACVRPKTIRPQAEIVELRGVKE